MGPSSWRGVRCRTSRKRAGSDTVSNVATSVGPALPQPACAVAPAGTTAPAVGGGGGAVDLHALIPQLEALVVSLQGLVQALGGATQAQPGAAAQAGTVQPGVAPVEGAVAVHAPAAPTGAVPGPVTPGAWNQSQSGGSVNNRSLGDPAPADGPDVVRKVLSKAQLEQDPDLRGKLEPPVGAKPPKGVEVRTDASGARVVTVNIHGGIPDNQSLNPKNESISAMRDVASYINAIDADVVMVQEINDRDSKVGGVGVSPMTSVMAHLMGASDMAYTPGNGADKSRRGTAIYTRNGYTIERAVNAALPGSNDPPRSAGVAVIQPPGGAPAFTAISTHLTHRDTRAASESRRVQLQELQRIAEQIARTGSFSYRSHGDGTQSSGGFPTDRIVLGGDLNTTQGGRNGGIDSADRLLGAAGMRHANDLYGRGRVKPRIDHVYARGFAATSSALVGIPGVEVRGANPTDHPSYVTDLR